MKITSAISPLTPVPSQARTAALADPSNAIKANDGWGDIVEELGSIRPTHRSRKSQVADFLLRRKKPDISADALGTATRAHTSRFFREALAHRSRNPQQGDGQSGSHPGAASADAAMAELLAAVKPARGAPGGSFDRAKAFAARRSDDVAQLLAHGGDEFRQELQVALVRNGMGGTKARKCTEVIYAALVAQFATDNEADRRAHYHGKIDALNSPAHTLASRLRALNGIEAELATETRLSSAGIKLIQARMADLRPLLEQSALEHEMLIAAATENITIDTPLQHIEGRLRELDERSLAINSSPHLSEPTRQNLHGLLQASRTMLTVLGTRSAHLDALADQPRLQDALRGLGARVYVKVQLGLTHAIDTVAPAYQSALLDRLNEIILGPREAGWIVAMQEGDAAITDMVLSGAQWDEQAWNLKLSAAGAPDDVALLNLSAQHELRKAARELDKAMQSGALKASAHKMPGNRGKDAHDQFPVNAFQALKADAALIGWLIQSAPQMLGQRDLAVANWIRLSLHNRATGLPDEARCKALFEQLRAKGIATGDIEIHTRQGFNSTSDVRACMSQIQAFSLALQKNSLVAAVDPQVRAAQIGMQLLQGLGIRADNIHDPAIDGQVKQLIDKALRQKSGTRELLQTLRRVAVIQVATQSRDPDFSPAGQNAAGLYSSQIMTRLMGMGLDLDSANPVLKEAATHLRQKLPADARTLEKLCSDFNPSSTANRARAIGKSAFGTKPSNRITPDANASAAAPSAKAAQAQVRRAANEAALKAAVANLKPDEVTTITFGDEVVMSVSAPVVPGLALAASLSAGRHNSIQIARTRSGAFAVEIVGGASARQGVSITTAMDVLDVSVGLTHARGKGYRVVYEQQAAYEGFLAALANGGDLAAHLQKASKVEAAAHTSLTGDVSITATADFTIASLSVGVAATAGERHSIHQNALFKREVFSRDVSAEVVLTAATAGDLVSAQARAGIALGVRRAVVRDNGMLAGRPQDSTQPDMTPTLSLVASGKRADCLNILLPGASPGQRQAIEAQLADVKDGTEMFTLYRLNETARVQANMLLGKAGSALTQAALQRPGPTQQALREQAVSFVKQADTVTRDPGNYAPEGFGWTLNSGNTVEKSRGAVMQYAQRTGEQTAFVPFKTEAGGPPPVGPSVLMAVMA